MPSDLKGYKTEGMFNTAKEASNTLEGLRDHVGIFIIVKEKNWAIHRTAELLIQKHNLKTFNDTDEIRYYNDGTYHPYADAMLGEEIECVWGKDASTHTTKEILNHVRRITYTPREQWNPKGYINLQNGVIDIATGQLVASDPTRPFTYALPINYDPDATCPNIEKFLFEVFRPEDLMTAIESVGYCLYTGYPIHRALLLFGGGSNGKSTFINLIKTFLGPENTSSISIQQLSEDQYSKSWLYGKLANLYSDLEDKALHDTGIFKILTGEDMITCNVKYGKDSLTFVNHAKMIFSANKFPKVYDDSDAFFRRWIILRFERTFTEAEADKGLLKKMTTPEELSGLLNLALAGLMQLLDHGMFTSTRTIEETREEYTRNSDTVGAFILDCIEQGDPDDEEYRAQKDGIYNAYIRYTKERKMSRKNEVWFWKDFRGRIEYFTHREKTSSGLKQFLKGVKLKESDNKMKESENPTGLTGYTGYSPYVCNYSGIVSNNREIPCLPSLPCKEVLTFIGEEATYNSLVLAFVNENFTEDQLKAVLDYLRNRGEVYEPKPGLFRPVENR